MNFLALQDAVMSRLNWTSNDARTLVKAYINQRYREVCSSVNTARTRRGLVTFTTVVGNSYVTGTGIAKLLDLYDAVTLKRPLQETTVEDIRARDAAGTTTGTPTHYAIFQHENDEITLLLYPQPTAAAALTADAVLAGTDMTVDTDEPTIPVDFHDVLTLGAEADGRVKMEKLSLAAITEKKFEKRLSELRYFLVKSAFLNRAPQDNAVVSVGRRVWPYSNLA